MEVGLVHYASAAGGLILTFAAAYAIVRYTPPPYRNIYFVVLALGMFAVGAGSRVTIAMGNKGLELEV